MIKLSIVSYLNSLPFLKGLQKSSLSSRLTISEDAPAVCADKISSGAADIGLVPVAVLPTLPSYSIVSDYCIGCIGEVYSVLLLSDVPLHEITHIKLDYQSRTSVQLVRILALHHWKISPKWEDSTSGFEAKITGTTAGVVIGDRAMVERKKHSYIYDLGTAWFDMTGLPFVFAVWIATLPPNEELIVALNSAFAEGIGSIPELVAGIKVPFATPEEIKKYLEHYIQYDYGSEQQKGMTLFLDYVRTLPELH
jgi:chorismate dehydratase